jgi:hypothetical protein
MAAHRGSGIPDQHRRKTMIGNKTVTGNESPKLAGWDTRRVHVAVVSLVLALGSHSNTASAQEDPAAAKAHYAAGLQHFNLSEYEQALVEFKEAYRSKPDPVFLYNIGQCHRRVGRVDEAITFYRSYLREAPEAKNRKEVEHRIEELEALQDAQSASITSSSVNPRPSPSSQAAQAQAVAATAVPRPTAGVDLGSHMEDRPSSVPIHRRWWFWATTGTVVVVGVTAAILVARRDPTAVPASTLGAQRAMP